MILYKNKGDIPVFASAEFDERTKTSFLFVNNEGDLDKAKALLAKVGQSVAAQTYVKGHIVLISKGTDPREILFKKLSEINGDKFEPKQPEKGGLLQFLRKHGWKLRGGSSVVGQSLNMFSAFKATSKENAAKGIAPKFDPAIGAFAALNLTANFVNYFFGGQKEEDINGLKKFDAIIAEEVNRYVPEGARKISPDEVYKLSYMNDKELAEHNKNRGPTAIIRQNSVRFGEVGLRTIGSLCMMFNYKNIGAGLSQLFKGNFKQAFLTAKVADRNTFIAGCGMVAGKMMGLFAKTYDPNNPPKTYVEEIRQKVLWITSSFTELVAGSFISFDRAKNKRLVLGGKTHYDYTGVVGNVLLTVPPYPTRLVLPYGEKVLDVQEVQARLLNELPKLPPDKIAPVTARVTARMVEHMGEKAPLFGELYSNVLAKLEAYHHIDASSQPAVMDQQAPEKNPVAKTDRKIAGNTIKNLLNKDNTKDPQGTAIQF